MRDTKASDKTLNKQRHTIDAEIGKEFSVVVGAEYFFEILVLVQRLLREGLVHSNNNVIKHYFKSLLQNY